MKQGWLEKARKIYFERSRINLENFIHLKGPDPELTQIISDINTRDLALKQVEVNLLKMIADEDKTRTAEIKINLYYDYLVNHLLQEENIRMLNLLSGAKGEFIFKEPLKAAVTAKLAYEKDHKEITSAVDKVDNVFINLQHEYEHYIELIRTAENVKDDSLKERLHTEAQQSMKKINELIKQSSNEKVFKEVGGMLFEVANAEYHDRAKDLISYNDVKDLCARATPAKETKSSTPHLSLSVNSDKLTHVKAALDEQEKMLMDKLNSLLKSNSELKHAVIEQLNDTRQSKKLIGQTLEPPLKSLQKYTKSLDH